LSKLAKKVTVTKRLSRADTELVSDVSANANGSSEAKAYVGTFINALKAGKEMRAQFDKIFQDLAKTYPEAWISKFNHATALGSR
jgi:hypothetical protein